MTDNNNKDRREQDGERSGGNLRRAAKILAVGAAAAGAAAAGYYFYASKDAARNRRVVARWASDFKDDVMRQAEELENIDREAIVGIIDGVSRAYGKMRNMNHADLREAADELKLNWQRLSSELERKEERIGHATSPMRTIKRPSRSVSRSRSRSKPRASVGKTEIEKSAPEE